MPRIRTIKPEFWSDEKIVELSPLARLLFIGLWNFADDSGNGERSARQIKMRIFPGDSIDVDVLIEELLRMKLISEYQVNGKKYLNIKHFANHQKINRPSGPKFPPPPEKEALTEDSLREGKGKEVKILEGKGKEEEGKRKRFTPPTIEEVSEYCKERKNKIVPQAFVDSYAAKGWMIGKSPMKDWKAAVRTWEARDKETGIHSPREPPKRCHIDGCTAKQLSETEYVTHCRKHDPVFGDTTGEKLKAT